jgi:hypothetical protein
MNMLAVINIFMGVTLALFVIARILQVIYVLATVACLVANWEDLEIACADMIKTACKDIPDDEGDVRTGVQDVLKALHDVELGVGVGWPWIAAGKTLMAGSYYMDHGVLGASSWAYSQIPLSVDEIGDPSSVQTALGGFSSITGAVPTDRFGLPVNSDTYSDNCKVAILDVTSIGGLIPGGISGQIARLLDTTPDFFCDAQANAVEGDIFQLLGKLKSICDPFGPPPTPIKDDDYSYSPVQLYDGGGDSTKAALMGMDYFGVWSTSFGAYTNALDVGAAQVKIAAIQAKTKPVIDPPPPDASLGVARAEFYYDPMTSEVGHGTGAQSDETSLNLGAGYPIHDVMWNMRWRARLRRYHTFPTVGVFEAIGGLFTGNMSAALKFAGQTLAGYGNSLLMKTQMSSQLGQLEQQLPAEWQNVLTNGGTADNTVTDPGSPIENVPGSVTGIYH